MRIRGDPAAHRESDLLAFQIAIERSRPGSIMCGYNKVNGEYACGNAHLLDDVLKDTWGYKGYVMSDWGATPSWDFAIKGLDQESGIQLDILQWGGEAFTDKLRKAYADGAFPKKRLSDMVRRMLYAAYSVGIDSWGPAPAVDLARHDAIALEMARQGIVLLENDGVLPIAADGSLKIAVIGGHAQTGILSGTGSGAVKPVGGYAGMMKIGGTGVGRNMFLFAPSPVAELKKALPNAKIEFDPGLSPAEAALTAKRADLVIARLDPRFLHYAVGRPDATTLRRMTQRKRSINPALGSEACPGFTTPDGSSRASALRIRRGSAQAGYCA